MNKNDQLTRILYNKIHLKQLSTGVFNRTSNSINTKNLKLNKNFFEGKICADLGCGNTGVGALNLLKLGAKEVHLMDLTKNIIKPIKKILAGYEDRYKIHLGSLKKLPFKKNSFDFVLCQNVLHHMDNNKEGFKEIFRVLKKKGKTYIAVQGAGGIIPKILYDVIIPEYKKNPSLKKIINDIMFNKKIKYNHFYKTNLNNEGLKLFNFLLKYIDDDLRLTLQDRILSPKYYQYDKKALKLLMLEMGFKGIRRIKKKVEINNLRTLLTPFYSNPDHLISKILYGDGDIGFIASK